MLDKSARLRDGRGRYPRAERPDFESIIAGFGDSWSAWRTLAIATQFREAQSAEPSSQSAERSSSLDQQEGGTTPPEIETRRPQHWASNKFFDQKLYQECTGRETPPEGPVKEVWAQVGRGGGKTRAAAAALVATAIRDYPSLAPGERGKAFLLAQNKGTARQSFNYINGILNSSKQLKRMILTHTKSQIQLSNCVDIEIVTSTYRHVRGFSCVAAVADEVAFWWIDQESANSDRQVLSALRPGLARVPGSVLWVISSPHATRGALYEANKRYYANEESDTVLFWKAPTEIMTPTFSAEEIKRAFDEDGSSASVEYSAEFKKDSETYISADAIDSVTPTDRLMLPPGKTTVYQAFIDTAGGAGGDSTAMAIGHVEEHRDLETPPTFVVDAIIERQPPFAPSETLKDFAKILKEYRVSKVVGDRYAGAFPAEAFSKAGVTFEATENSKSQIYKAVLPLITSGRVELLDKPRLRNQLLNLERRATTGGREVIDHHRGAHDDVANCVCGLLVYLSEKGVKNHGTQLRSGHFLKLLWPSGDRYYCIGKSPSGECIPGKRRRPAKSNKDTYHLSDKLWAEIEAMDPLP